MIAPTKGSHLEQSDSDVGPTLSSAVAPASIVLASDEFLMPDEVS